MHDRSRELKELMNRAWMMPAGKSRAALWAQAATLAEEEGSLGLAVDAYTELCSSYQSAGEITRVIAPFMWLDRMRRERPDLFTETHIHRFGWFYKFVLIAVAHVPTVPVSQWESILEQMREHYSGVGDSMRAYYYRLYQLHTAMGEEEAAARAFDLWINAEHSDLTDCQGCAPGQIVGHYSDKGLWQEAVQAGEEGLAGEGRLCSSQPEALLSEMLEPWLRCGDDAQAWPAHVRSYRKHQASARYFNYLHYHLRYLTLSAQAGRPQRLERALRILCRHLPWMIEASTPSAVRDFAAAAALVCDAVPEQKHERVLPVTLPGKHLKWVEAEELTDPTIAETAQWMRHLATKIAAQFDARPGNRAPGREHQRLERAFHPQPLAPLPDNGPIQDVTGLGDYQSSLTFLLDEENSKDRQAPVASEPHSVATSDNDGNSSHSFVPLPLHGAWETMSFHDLLRECANAGVGVPTIWAYTALERMWSDPRYADLTMENDLPEDVVVAWRWLRYLAGEAFVPGYTIALHAMETTDPAFSQLDAAQVAMAADDCERAITCVHEAFSTPSIEPLGLRLRGLRVWADALRYQGADDEAIALNRERANLAALVGLPGEMAQAASDLSALLLRRGDVYYAAEVAQNGLDAVERHAYLDGVTSMLHFYSARAHALIGQDEIAARHYLHTAERYSRHGHEVNAANLMHDAAMCFLNVDNFAQAFDVLSQACEIARHSYVTDAEHYHAATEEEERQACASKATRSASSLARCLHALAKGISWQPDPISHDDHEGAETLMNELRTLTLSEDYLRFTSLDPQLQDAHWHSQMAEIHANCARISLAKTFINDAMSRFIELGDVHGRATALVIRANLLVKDGEPREALSDAQEALKLLADVPREESAAKSRAEELIRILGNATPE